MWRKEHELETDSRESTVDQNDVDKREYTEIDRRDI